MREEPGARFLSRKKNGQTFLRQTERNFFVRRKVALVNGMKESLRLKLVAGIVVFSNFRVGGLCCDVIRHHFCHELYQSK